MSGAFCPTPVGKRQRPRETAARALYAVVALLAVLVLGLALAGDREDVVLELDVDVLLLHPGQVRAEHEVIVLLHEVHRWHPAAQRSGISTEMNRVFGNFFEAPQSADCCSVLRLIFGGHAPAPAAKLDGGWWAAWYRRVPAQQPLQGAMRSHMSASAPSSDSEKCEKKCSRTTARWVTRASSRR